MEEELNLYRLPYGQRYLTFQLPGNLQVEMLVPARAEPATDPLGTVNAALNNPAGGRELAAFAGATSAAIAINDKTRPVPHQHLLPPLLEQRMAALGLPPEAITLLIAAGTHPPMPPGEFESVVPAEIAARYPIVCHDTADRDSLAYLGRTGRGTPVWINRRFIEAELRIVVGNIEPHQFMGFSGGVKSAVIGLGGPDTINHNHALMTDPMAKLGVFDDNLARQDVEEMGRLVGVHFALNAILNESKQIVAVLAGEPQAVMRTGIPLVRQLYQVAVPSPFDLVIASPGGHPKDINLYQAQKGLAHAALVTREGGTIILAAACPEGTGSDKYEQWMVGMTSYEAVLARFQQEGFRIGSNKTFQLARDAARARVILVSDMPASLVQGLLLTPAANLDSALAQALPGLTPEARVGVMPWANATIPALVQQDRLVATSS